MSHNQKDNDGTSSTSSHNKISSILTDPRIEGVGVVVAILVAILGDILILRLALALFVLYVILKRFAPDQSTPSLSFRNINHVTRSFAMATNKFLGRNFGFGLRTAIIEPITYIIGFSAFGLVLYALYITLWPTATLLFQITTDSLFTTINIAKGGTDTKDPINALSVFSLLTFTGLLIMYWILRRQNRRIKQINSYIYEASLALNIEAKILEYTNTRLRLARDAWFIHCKQIKDQEIKDRLMECIPSSVSKYNSITIACKRMPPYPYSDEYDQPDIFSKHGFSGYYFTISSSDEIKKHFDEYTGND